MTDVIDQAQAFEAINLEQSLQVQRLIARNTTRPTASGYCLNAECDEPFDDDAARLFCGPRCAERFDVQQKQKR